MKVGDLVIRKIRGVPEWQREAAINQKFLLGCGIILSKHIAGEPAHPCVSVFYPKVEKTYDIAESLLEVISESR